MQREQHPKRLARLDVRMVELGLAPSRARAQDLIRRGLVDIAGVIQQRPGAGVAACAAIHLSQAAGDHVSRGALKLIAALDHFRFPVADVVALDVGASTGGFTQTLLARGAARIYAVDVGHGQLDARLRADPRVVVRERVNARGLSRVEVPETVRLAVIDVSFISLEKVLGPVASTLRPGPGHHIVALVKPQFEAGKGRTDHGVVRDPAIHREVLERVVEAAAAVGLGARAVIASPITGPEGNREFLVDLARGPSCAEIGDRIAEVTGA
jgi:23S rRNA (cytidine1920-2'-O)/16S rRNA (cytidine1409-2'-O)-methyltransferase